MIAAFLAFLISLVGVASGAEMASHYGRGDGYYGKPVACAGYGMLKPGDTTAHKTLPCGTKVKLTNPHNGKSVVVTVTDRGPFIKGRTWDVNSSVATKLGMDGLASLQSEVIGK